MRAARAFMAIYQLPVRKSLPPPTDPGAAHPPERMESGGPETVPFRIADRLNRVLDRWLPEKRIFLRSDDQTRFVRLRPLTQLGVLAGGTMLVGWTLLSASIFAIDAVSTGGADRTVTAQVTFEKRLTELSKERDASLAEATAAQDRFGKAMTQLSQMQTQLLQSEERLHELESGLKLAQGNLSQANRDTEAAQALANGQRPADADSDSYATALDILSGELESASSRRVEAESEAARARLAAHEATTQRDELVARTDEIFTQIEDALTLSAEPLEDLFENVGIDAEKLLETVDKGYYGQGGPLTPMGYSTHGNAAITESEARANKVIVSLDKVNRYRIGADLLPFAMPVKDSFRFTSEFGRRWGRAHEGIDLAAPIGTPVHAPGEGTVIFAGWQSGYGNLIKIQHALGTETRYGHLSRIHVKVGQKVSRGDKIGAIGNTGRSTGPHLHYEVRVDGRAVNPMSFIKAAQNVF